MIFKSTRTFILDHAKCFAISLYDQHFDAKDPGVKHDDVNQTTKTLFSDLAIKLMGREASRRDRSELAHLSYKADQIRLDTEILPYF